MTQSTTASNQSPRPLWAVSGVEMQRLDTRTIQEAKVRGTTLMERAGTGVVSHILDSFGAVKGKHVVIVCGKGNNGGDGLVVARQLKKKGSRISVILMSPIKNLSKDASLMYQRFRKLGRGASVVIQPTPTTLETLVQNADLVVDALLGTGLSSPVQGPLESAINVINTSSAYTVAIDIPSGIESRTGAILGTAVNADLTVTFGYPKIGLYVGQAIDKVGRIQIVDIGIPPEFIEDIRPTTQVISPALVAQYFPPRQPSSHKGTFGHAGIVAGSPGKTGAPAMASLGALRSGAGLVTVATPQNVSHIVESKVLEAMTSPMPETSSGELGMEALDQLLLFSKNKSAMAFGPGMGITTETGSLLRHLLPQIEGPCVLDADALTVLAPFPEMYATLTYPPILTPHPGEMARMIPPPPLNPLMKTE